MEYSIDYDAEKVGYDFIDTVHVKLIDGSTMPWEDVKNGISWLVITLFDKDNRSI